MFLVCLPPLERGEAFREGAREFQLLKTLSHLGESSKRDIKSYEYTTEFGRKYVEIKTVRD